MTIDQQGGSDEQQGAAAGSPAQPHSQAALEQSALYAARLAIARWSSSSANTFAAATEPGPDMAQAAWYAETQRNFQEWLARGGFAQDDVVAPSGCLAFVCDGHVTFRPLPGVFVADAQKISE